MWPSRPATRGLLEAFLLPQGPFCAPHRLPASSRSLAPLRPSILLSGCQKGFKKPGSKHVIHPPRPSAAAHSPQDNVPAPCPAQDTPGDQPLPVACLFLPCWLSPPCAHRRALRPAPPSWPSDPVTVCVLPEGRCTALCRQGAQQPPVCLQPPAATTAPEFREAPTVCEVPRAEQQ